MTATPRQADAPATRSMADDIRGRSDDQLRDLLRRRQDLARPAPADVSSLAARASTRASVQRAVDALDLAHLQTLEAALVTASPIVVDAVADLLDAPSTQVAALLEDLWTLALLWRSPQGLRVVRTVSEVLPQPAGLGPSAADLPVSLPPQQDLATLVETAPATARAILDRLTWGPPTALLPPGAPDRVAQGARWLLEHQLVAASGDHLQLPREVALVLRGGRVHAHPALSPPTLTGTERDPESVDSAAGQEVTDLLALLDELAAHWGLRPPRVLRAGGLAVRDLTRLASVLDVDRDRAAFVTEIAYAAGLLADDGALEPSWAPTPAYDEWAQQPGAARWAVVAQGWLASTRSPHLVGTTSPGGSGSINALGPDAHWPPARALRRDVL
ncbi:MAG TPA: hypothetical protein VGN48_18830, partial [Pedococcus sp.]|nr:hypothetical protein [Pedococcus sp.]